MSALTALMAFCDAIEAESGEVPKEIVLPPRAYDAVAKGLRMLLPPRSFELRVRGCHAVLVKHEALTLPPEEGAFASDADQDELG